MKAGAVAGLGVNDSWMGWEVRHSAETIADLIYRTLVYLEGEASMSQFQDAEGKNRSALNIVQRECNCSVRVAHR